MADYTEDYYFSREPYEEIAKLDSEFERKTALEKLERKAKSAGISATKIRSCYKSYLKDHNEGSISENHTHFTDQPIALNCGDYKADDYGIISPKGEIVCHQPILIIGFSHNGRTNEEKVKIAFKKRNRWDSIIVGKNDIASTSQIVQLAKTGLNVNSENARQLVKYFYDLDRLNPDIPITQSYDRLGYTAPGVFAPYGEGLQFDGDPAYNNVIESLVCSGSFEKWENEVLKCRKESVIVKIMIAAAFASPLLKGCGAPSFFVHLYSAESGNGKTVALMIATSIYADPTAGRYMQTFNSTTVGLERRAAFYNQLPLVMDELQLQRDTSKAQQFSPYALTEGAGKTRGNKNGTIDETPTWNLAILSSGESPITSSNSAAGAKNRILEIKVPEGEKVINNGIETAAIVKENFGHAGRMFIEKCFGRDDEIRIFYQTTLSMILESTDTTEKQAIIAAALLTADQYATMWIFHDDPLTIEEITPFLQKRADVDVNVRAYDYLIDYIITNKSHFATDYVNPINGCYGVIERDKDSNKVACMLKTQYDIALAERGFDSRNLSSWMKANGKIEIRPDGKGTTVNKRIEGMAANCICIKMPSNL